MKELQHDISFLQTEQKRKRTSFFPLINNPHQDKDTHHEKTKQKKGEAEQNAQT